MIHSYAFIRSTFSGVYAAVGYAAVGVSGSQKGDNFQVMDCVFTGLFDITTLSQHFFSFLPDLRIRPCFALSALGKMPHLHH